MASPITIFRHNLLLCCAVLLPGCAGDQPTAAAPPQEPTAVIRGFANGCVPEVTTEYTDSTETLTVVFVGTENCVINPSKWGIDMGDPMASDTPQGGAMWQFSTSSNLGNIPFPSNGVAFYYATPPQNYIEFGPPVRSATFYYSRWEDNRAYWGGTLVDADSMQVRAVSRFPGTNSYWQHARKVIYSTVPFGTAHVRWDSATLTARGDEIEWLWFDGSLVLNAVKARRAPLVCTPSVQRGERVVCEVVSPNLSVTGWEFQPDSSNLPSIQEASTSKTWAGPAVMGGTVTAHVTSDGGARSFKARFRVTNRPWKWSDQWEYRDTTMLQAEPPFVNEMGKTEIIYARNEAAEGRYMPWIMPEVTETDPARRGYALAQVPAGGPNAGYWYVQSMSLHMHRRGRLNPFVTQLAAMNLPLEPTLVKDCKRYLDGGSTINFYRFNLCKRKDVEDFLAGVRAHEGYGRNGGTGHQGLAEAAAALDNNDPYKLAEPRVRGTRDELDALVQRNVPWMADGIYVATRDRQYPDDPIGPRGNWAGRIWDWIVNVTPNRFIESPYDEF